MLYVVEFWEEHTKRFRAVTVECDDERFLPAETAKAGHQFSKIIRHYPYIPRKERYAENNDSR